MADSSDPGGVLDRIDGRAHRKDLRGLEVPDLSVEVIERFHRQQQRWGLADSSIKARTQKLRLLAEWIAPRALTDAAREDIECFLDDRVLAPNTRYHYLSHFSMLYDWLIDEEMVSSNPARSIRRPRVRLGLPRPIADDDLEFALKAADAAVAAMMTLAAFQGMRAQEIAGLPREDVLDTHAPPTLIVVHGKGRKERPLPLHPETMPALRRADLPRSGHALRRPSGHGYVPWQVSHAVNRHLKALGIDATIHQLRHWFGTKTYQHTRDLRLVQGLMGHSLPTTTAVYAQYAVEGARQAVESLAIGHIWTGSRHGQE
jgi:integrase/recombinase XerD